MLIPLLIDGVCHKNLFKITRMLLVPLRNPLFPLINRLTQDGALHHVIRPYSQTMPSQRVPSLDQGELHFKLLHRADVVPTFEKLHSTYM